MVNINDTNVLNILDAMNSIAEDKDVIILTLEPPRGSKETAVIYDDQTEYKTLETDKDFKYLDEQYEPQSPKQKNILRWLPKKKRNRTNRTEKKNQEAIAAERLKVKAQNAERVDYIYSVIKDHREAADFLYREVKRIQRDRILVDDIRELILRVEAPGQEDFKQKVINCYKKAKAETDVKVEDGMWNKPTNNLNINIVKDQHNDGVYG